MGVREKIVIDSIYAALSGKTNVRRAGALLIGQVSTLSANPFADNF